MEGMEYKAPHNGRDNESGNALWLVLLVVALLAVLTAFISRSSDTAEQSGDVERFRIQASQMMRYTAGLREAIGRMRMQDIGENAIDFTSSGFSNPCQDCLLFGSAGGGQTYMSPSSDWLDSGHSGDSGYGDWNVSGENSITDVGTANPELIIYLPYLKPSLCTQINKLLKISGIPADADGFDTTAFSGGFAATATIDNMDGKETGCFEDSSVGGMGYTYYQVLIKR